MQDLVELFNLAPRIFLTLGFIIILFIGGRVLKFSIRRMKSIPPDAKNGINLIITLSQIFLGITGISIIFNAGSDILLGSSAIIATAVGFASTSTAANLVGGLYIIITRPFGIGDMVQINSVNGIVVEIGINYTKILRIDKTIVTIPNSKLLNASLKISNISVSHELRKREEAKQLQFNKVSLTIPRSFLDLVDDDEFVRFSTKITLKLNQTTPPIQLSVTKERLNNVCDAFTSVFGFRPRFYFGEHVFRQDTHLVITAVNSEVLLNNYSAFMESVFLNVFADIQEGGDI